MPVNSLIPNILTVLALCAGMSAIRFALLERWEAAVAAIAVAAVLDGLDGRMARLLKGATKFGAELDSLSDFIAFGVAPGILIFLWSTQELQGLGWIASLAYSTCCALRLARFNTALDDPDRPAWAGLFFTGVAAPAGAALAVLPMMLSFQFEAIPINAPPIVALWLLFVGFLMVSQVPTFSFKRVRVRRELVLPTLLVVGLMAAVMVSYPWFVLSAITIAYLTSIPFSFASHRRYATARAGVPSEDEDKTPSRTDETG
jgi:CDP-diacylglycerol--serine O-phosphatidyltransferase